MLRIVTDGGADMPNGWETSFGIDMVPLYVRFGEKSYLQGVDINSQSFYDLVQKTRIVPKTSLPSPAQVIEFYKKIAQKGDEILSIHIGSKLSGTFSVIQMAAQELKNDFKIVTVDSGAGSAALGFMCRDARLMHQNGAPLEKIAAKLADFHKKVVVVFTLDTLEYAYLNGRVSALQTALSSMLRIKPIIVLKDGLLSMVEKVRTRTRSIDRILDIVREKIGLQEVNLAVVHAIDPSTAQILHDKAKKMFNCREIVITDLSFPVAANLGPGAVGIIAYPVNEEHG